jgi:hypothetical protein
VLKHIRQNSLTSLCYSVADEGKVKQNSKTKNQNMMPQIRVIMFLLLPIPSTSRQQFAHYSQ